MKENNQMLTSPIQKIEGRLCELYLSTIDQNVDNCMCLIEDLNTRIACLEKSKSEIQTNREEHLLQKIHILEDAILQKEALSKNLKSELDHKTKEVELLPNENVRFSEDLESKCTDLRKKQDLLDYNTKKAELVRNENVKLTEDLELKCTGLRKLQDLQDTERSNKFAILLEKDQKQETTQSKDHDDNLVEI